MNKTVHSTAISRQRLLAAIKSISEEHNLVTSYISPGIYKTSLPLTAVYDIIKSWKLKELGE